MKLLRPTACAKTIKSTLKICLSNTWNKIQDATPHLFPYQSSCHYPSQYFFNASPKRVSSPYHPSAFDHVFFDQ